MRAQDLRGFGPVGTNGPAESFDAVLDKIRTLLEVVEAHGMADRLAAAHAAEVAERSAAFDSAKELMARDLRNAMADSRRIDALETFVAEEGGLRIHGGNYHGNFGGLAVDHGRTLRQALDVLAPAIANQEPPHE